MARQLATSDTRYHSWMLVSTSVLSSDAMREAKLIAAAGALAAAAASATTPDQAKRLQQSLASLLVQARGLPVAISTISNFVSSCDSHINRLSEQERYASWELSQSYQMELSKEARHLQGSLDRLGLLSPQDKAYLETLVETKIYSITTLDDQGKPVGVAKASGAELKEAFILMASFTHQHKLSPEDQKAFYRLLHGKDTPPANAQERKIAAETLKNAARKSSGHAYSIAATPEERERISRNLADSISKINQWEMLLQQRDLLPPDSPQRAAAEALSADALRELKSKFSTLRRDIASKYVEAIELTPAVTQVFQDTKKPEAPTSKEPLVPASTATITADKKETPPPQGPSEDKDKTKELLPNQALQSPVQKAISDIYFNYMDMLEIQPDVLSLKPLASPPKSSPITKASTEAIVSPNTPTTNPTKKQNLSI